MSIVHFIQKAKYTIKISLTTYPRLKCWVGKAQTLIFDLGRKWTYGRKALILRPEIVFHHEPWVLITCVESHSFNMCAQLSSGVRGLYFDQSQSRFLICVNEQEKFRCWLVFAFAAC